MKNTFRYGLVAIVLCIIHYACSKQDAVNESSKSTTSQLNISSEQLTVDSSRFKALVQTVLDSFHKSEAVIGIDSTCYNNTTTNKYILVHYHSNLGISNVLIKGDYQDGQLFAATTTKCEGSCDCKVQVVYDKDVTISCTCNSCAMVITQIAFADFTALASYEP